MKSECGSGSITIARCLMAPSCRNGEKCATFETKGCASTVARSWMQCKKCDNEYGGVLDPSIKVDNDRNSAERKRNGKQQEYNDRNNDRINENVIDNTSDRETCRYTIHI